MARSVSLLGGLGLGALLMYFVDPDKGKRRRSILRDQGIHLAHETQDMLRTGARDLGNRVVGQVSEMQSALNHELPLDDILVARVRAKMGRFLSHPSAIEVRAHEGIVSLRGPILAEEVDRLLIAARNVRGVLGLEDHLEVHEHAGNIPALQQGPKVTGEAMELFQNNWAPGIRLLAILLGGAIALTGLRRKGLLGFASSLAGTLALTRGLTNEPPNRLFGLTGETRGITVQKTLNINAPIERVFDAWLHMPENYSQFMPSIRNIRVHDSNRAHWEVIGPMGLHLSGEALLSKVIPNKLIAWKSEKDATIKNSGTIHFESTPNGGTRVQINLTYNPPLGTILHLLASLFGIDPKQRLDDELIKMKTILEQEVKQGQPTHPRIVM